MMPELTDLIAEDTPHFRWIEVACRHCGRLPENEQAVVNAARMMEKIRAILGDHPLHVNSWYRCPVHNRNIGGATNSQHLYGRAVDFTSRVLSARQVQAKLRPHLGSLIGGLGRYISFTHADNRPEGRGALWSG